MFTKKDQLKKTKKPSPKKLMEEWALKVKELAGMKCEYCGKVTTLNSHHIYSRSKKSTRYDIDNGVCLCVAHHTFSSGFSAHKTPMEFSDFIRKKRGEEWYERLKNKANALNVN